MKEKLLKLLAERDEVFLTELLILIPEIKGDYYMFMPIKPGYNKNILWIGGVSQEFIDTFNELVITNKIVDWNPRSFWDAVFYAVPVYTEIQTINANNLRTQEYCWMPISLKLNSPAKETIL